MFDCHLDEMDASDLREFPNLNAFFTRRLKSGIRPIHRESPLVSPADARILHYGPVTEKSLEQVKGITYSLDQFLGCGEHSWDPKEPYHHVPYDTNRQLYHIVLYLAPGDYHRFHSPAQWSVEKLKYFTGKLYSVSPGFVRIMKGVFAQNERIVMLGGWSHGFFSMTAVGATNVGSIQLKFDSSFKTNQRIRDPEGSYVEKCMVTQKLGRKPKQLVKVHADDKNVVLSGDTSTGVAAGLRGFPFQKGDEVGQFNLGSTIVLVFEAPKDFTFCVEAGDKVKVGEPLGFIHDTDPSRLHLKQSHPAHRTVEQVQMQDGKEGYV